MENVKRLFILYQAAIDHHEFPILNTEQSSVERFIYFTRCLRLIDGLTCHNWCKWKPWQRGRGVRQVLISNLYSWWRWAEQYQLAGTGPGVLTKHRGQFSPGQKTDRLPDKSTAKTLNKLTVKISETRNRALVICEYLQSSVFCLQCGLKYEWLFGVWFS